MRRMTVIAVLLTVLMVAGCTSSGSPEVIAEVNGSKITQQEYEHRIKLVSGSYKIQQRSMGASEEVVIEDSVLSQIKEIAYNQLIMISSSNRKPGPGGFNFPMRIRTGTWRISKLCRRTAAAPVRMSRFCRISPSLRPSSRRSWP